MTWQAIEQVRAGLEAWARAEWHADYPAAKKALSVVEEALEAAALVEELDRAGDDWWVVRTARIKLYAALARAREGIKP